MEVKMKERSKERKKEEEEMYASYCITSSNELPYSQDHDEGTRNQFSKREHSHDP